MVHETLVLVGDIATYFFVWSYKTGKFIVSVLCFIARSLYLTAEKLIYLLRILVGDFELFVQDVSRISNNIVNSVNEIYDDHFRSLNRVSNFFLEYIFSITSGIRNFLSNVYFSLEETLNFIVNCLKLIGPAVWFLVTLPNSIFQLIVHCISDIISHLHALHSKTHMFLHNIYIHLVRVPTEACTGLIFLIIFGCLVIRLRKFISNICRKSIMFLFSLLNLNIIKLPLKVLRSIFVKSNPVPYECSAKTDDSHLCIVCQSNPRSIVLLPCRHLCLCDKCSIELVRYRTTNCPVCRQETNLKLRVYL